MSNFRAVVGEVTTPSRRSTLLLVPGQNLRTGLTDVSNRYPDYTSLEQDLLTVTSAIFACDVAFKRGEREEITRSIELQVPVVNHAVFEGVKTDLEVLLWILSDDNWTLTFQRVNGTPEARRDWPQGAGATVLFSGGVDSFVGAHELLAARGVTDVQLASHLTGNRVTRQSQQDLVSYLETKFGSSLNRIAVRTGGTRKDSYTYPSDADREETQRTPDDLLLDFHIRKL
jgi:hypothetical protein